MNITGADISKAFDSVPPSLKEAINNVDTVTAVTHLGTEYGFHVDVVGQLNSLALMVCLGLLPARDFVYEVQKIVPQMPPQQFAELIQKINTAVFEPIRQYEEKLAEQKRDDEEFEKLAKNYTEEEVVIPITKTSEPVPARANISDAPITLADIKSNVTPLDVQKQKMTISAWKSANVIKSETQKAVIAEYKDQPDPYKEML